MANNWGQRRRKSLHDFIEKRLTLIPFVPELGQTWAEVMTQSGVIGRRLVLKDVTALIAGEARVVFNTLKSCSINEWRERREAENQE